MKGVGGVQNDVTPGGGVKGWDIHGIICKKKGIDGNRLIGGAC